MANKYMKKNAQIPVHKGNANQSNIEISPHSSQNDYHQEHKQQQMNVDEVGGSGKCFSFLFVPVLHCGRNYTNNFLSV
jgi:hypothetical protein